MLNGVSVNLRQRSLVSRLSRLPKRKHFLKVPHEKSLKLILKESHIPFLMGFLLIFGGTVVLFWNEGKAVTTARTLDEGFYSVNSVSDSEINSENDGKLVHLTGTLSITSPILDPRFGIRATAVQLKRRVQVYQWIEEKLSFLTDASALPETSMYEYVQAWKDKLVNSDVFYTKEGHDNPKSIPIQPEIRVAKHVRVGAFQLSEGVKKVFTKFHPFSGDEEPPGGNVKLHNGMYFLTNDIFNPQVGDLRIQFYFAGHTDELVTIVAKQEKDSLHPYVTSSGKEILIIRPGKLSAEEMFVSEHSQSRFSIWSYRIFGWFLIFLGSTCISSLVHHFMFQNSFFREILFLGFGSSNLTLSLTLSLLLIGGAWCFYSPLFSLILFAVAASPLFRKILQDNCKTCVCSNPLQQILFRSKFGTA